MEITTIFKALSDETRLRIIKLLEHGELCVCDIAAVLESSQPKISFHLSTLRESGLITDRREGKWIHYRLTDSDMFRRFLMMSVFERFDTAIAEQDINRLKSFLSSKKTSEDEDFRKEVRCVKCS